MRSPETCSVSAAARARDLRPNWILPVKALVYIVDAYAARRRSPNRKHGNWLLQCTSAQFLGVAESSA